MKIELTDLEARVIGCLMEKQVTTPDSYPLSLNALTSACNQKSSRDPVMSLSETVVQETLDLLAKQHLVSDRSGFSGSRVTKYKHRFCNTEFGSLQLTDQEYAVICIMLLRGPQSPGELRTRSNRMCQFTDNNEVEQVLRELIHREPDPLVVEIPRAPGQRDARYMHLFCGEIDVSEYQPAQMSLETEPRETHGTRIDRLEDIVVELRREIDEIKNLLS
ncbi:MAG: YceH family protein [Pseudomonadota bacterium]